MPVNANLAFREFGIALFFAAVGLVARRPFSPACSAPRACSGGRWAVHHHSAPALPPPACLGRLVLKMDFTTLSGLLAWSVTDPPAWPSPTTSRALRCAARGLLHGLSADHAAAHCHHAGAGHRVCSSGAGDGPTREEFRHPLQAARPASVPAGRLFRATGRHARLSRRPIPPPRHRWEPFRICRKALQRSAPVLGRSNVMIPGASDASKPAG